jgi:hypothetical protein
LSIQIPRRIKEGPPPPSHALSDQPWTSTLDYHHHHLDYYYDPFADD